MQHVRILKACKGLINEAWSLDRELVDCKTFSDTIKRFYGGFECPGTPETDNLFCSDGTEIFPLLNIHPSS